MSVVIVLFIALLGYSVGELNGRFLSCNEFKVSGNTFLPIALTAAS